MFRKLTDGVFARRRWIYLTYPSQTETAEGVWRVEALPTKKKEKPKFSLVAPIKAIQKFCCTGKASCGNLTLN